MSYAAGADWEDSTGRFLREIDRIRSEATVIAALSVLFFSSLSSVILSYTIETIGGNQYFRRRLLVDRDSFHRPGTRVTTLWRVLGVGCWMLCQYFSTLYGVNDSIRTIILIMINITYHCFMLHCNLIRPH
jgi:hypothetical protein